MAAPIVTLGGAHGHKDERFLLHSHWIGSGHPLSLDIGDLKFHWEGGSQ